MKMQIFKICSILMVFSITMAGVLAQQKQNSSEKEFNEYEQTRNLFQTSSKTKSTVKKATKKRRKSKSIQRSKTKTSNKPTNSSVGKPGMKIWLERQAKCEGEFLSVAPTAVFRSGDCLRMRFWLNFEGYVNVISLGTTGANIPIFPLDNQANRIFPKSNNYLPDNQGLEFDENPGNEQFVFIVSRSEINQEFVQSYLNNRSLVTADSSDLEVYDRDVKPRSEKDSVYVLSDETRLEKPLVFRMTIKHQ